LPGVATLRQKLNAEVRVRELIAQNGLPEPDEVEHGLTCIRLLWHESKVVLVIDIDTPPEAPDATEEPGPVHPGTPSKAERQTR
jgi:hypothetical protein